MTRDRSERDALILDHLHLVHRIVGSTLRRLPRHVRRDDLTSAGNLGLVQASSSFDADRGVPFDRWAGIRIHGAIGDELREMDWAPRSLRPLAREVDAARAELATALRRSATDHEVAAALGISLVQVVEAAHVGERAKPLSLDAFPPDVAATLAPAENAVSVEAQVLARIEAAELQRAVAVLPAHLRTVVWAAFHPDQSHRQAAAAVGIPPGDFYLLRSEAIRALRAALGVAAPAGERRIPLPRRLAALLAA